MSTLNESILSAAKALPEGGLLSPKEFLHLGSRAAIDQAFTRLAKEERLLRVGRGTYTRPVASRFGVRPPSTEAVIEAIETVSGEVVVSHGAAEANVLGLTKQVPTREVFLTSGVSRILKLGNRMLELKHGQRWQLALGKRPAGKAVRALDWVGPESAPHALNQIKKKLTRNDWQDLLSARSLMPSWMARLVSESSPV